MSATAGAVVATGLIQGGSAVWQKLTGIAYKESDIARLKELKRIYQETLHVPPPVSWDLDDKNCPTSQILNKRWATHIQQLRQSKHSVSYYHHQSSLITEYASTYLIARSERARATLAKGRPGDVTEQFLADWIHFALNDLPTFTFDEESVSKIKKRLQYIRKVQKHELIFKYGFIHRAKNKMDAIESIRLQLESCLEIATQEASRQCARERFDSCRVNLSAMLFACSSTLYYARATDVHSEPLDFLSYVEPHGRFFTKAAKAIHEKIHHTHTGAILKEIIISAGLDAFGSLGTKQTILPSHIYYNQVGKLQRVNWQARSTDLPHWVGEDAKRQVLREIQQLGESIIRVAKVKRLLEDAYDLTGKIGDLWAYGDKQGKLSLKALLFLLNSEVTLLKLRFDEFYQNQNELRQAYNLKNHINPGEGINPNFNKVDEQKNNIDLLIESIKQSSHAMKEQMEQFPEDSKKTDR